MTTYQYQCSRDGITEVKFPMGSATSVVPCQECGEPARRVFSPPMLSTPHQNAMKVIDATKETSDRPKVVDSLPSAGRRRTQPMAPLNPAFKKLPRP